MFESIRRFSESTDADKEPKLFQDSRIPSPRNPSPRGRSPRNPSPRSKSPQTKVSDTATKKSKSRKSVSKRVTISDVDENVPHEDLHIDYNLRDGSSLSHLPGRQALIKTPAKRNVQAPANKRVSTPGIALRSPYDSDMGLKVRAVTDDDASSVSSANSDNVLPAKLIYRRF